MRLIECVAVALAVVSIVGRSSGRPTVIKNKYFDKNIPDSETSLTVEDFNNADKLLTKGKPDTVDTKAMENPNMFEGDIAGLNKSTISRFLSQTIPNNDTNGIMRNAIRGTFNRWPNAIIPYTISNQFSSTACSDSQWGQYLQNASTKRKKCTGNVNKDTIARLFDNWSSAEIGKQVLTRLRIRAAEQRYYPRNAKMKASDHLIFSIFSRPTLLEISVDWRAAIADAIRQYAQKTCIKFIPRTNQRDYIQIKVDGGCYSWIGRKGGSQTLSLGGGCLQRGIIMHELMHAVGFFHEHARPDRDQFVEVLYQNIQNGKADDFKKQDWNRVDLFGQPFDYNSIMLYGPKIFSKNGQDTLRPKAKGVKLYQRDQFSNIDLNKLKRIANCR